MKGAVVTVVNLLAPPVPCFAFTERKNQQTGPQPFSPLPTSSHVGTVQVRPGGPLALSTERHYVQEHSLLLEMLQIPQSPGERLNRISAEEAPPDFFSHMPFPRLSSQAAHTERGLQPIVSNMQRRRWFARRDAQRPFHLHGLSLFFISIAVRCRAQK